MRRHLCARLSEIVGGSRFAAWVWPVWEAKKSRDCSARNSTNPDRDQLATVLKSCTTLSSDRPAQEDTAVPRLAPSSGSHQSSASTAASRGPKTRRRSQPARAPCPEPSAAATSAALWPSFSFLGPHHPPYARAPRGDQQQSLQGSASFTPMLVQTERHPAGLAAPRAGHGSRQGSEGRGPAASLLVSTRCRRTVTVTVGCPPCAARVPARTSRHAG